MAAEVKVAFTPNAWDELIDKLPRWAVDTRTKSGAGYISLRFLLRKGQVCFVIGDEDFNPDFCIKEFEDRLRSRYTATGKAERVSLIFDDSVEERILKNPKICDRIDLTDLHTMECLRWQSGAPMSMSQATMESINSLTEEDRA